MCCCGSWAVCNCHSGPSPTMYHLTASKIQIYHPFTSLWEHPHLCNKNDKSAFLRCFSEYQRSNHLFLLPWKNCTCHISKTDTEVGAGKRQPSKLSSQQTAPWLLLQEPAMCYVTACTRLHRPKLRTIRDHLNFSPLLNKWSLMTKLMLKTCGGPLLRYRSTLTNSVLHHLFS